MSDFKTRLLEEKQQLDERAGKLHAFINGSKFNTISLIQQSLLKVQYQAMITYGMCLDERVDWLETEERNA